MSNICTGGRDNDKREEGGDGGSASRKRRRTSHSRFRYVARPVQFDKQKSTASHVSQGSSYEYSTQSGTYEYITHHDCDVQDCSQSSLLLSSCTCILWAFAQVQLHVSKILCVTYLRHEILIVSTVVHNLKNLK